jgi:hypothetical protein
MAFFTNHFGKNALATKMEDNNATVIMDFMERMMGGDTTKTEEGANPPKIVKTLKTKILNGYNSQECKTTSAVSLKVVKK